MKQTVDPDYKKEFAARLKQIRKDSKLSQRAFAESIGITRVHYNRMESPDILAMASRPIQKKICEKYNVNYKWLSTGTGDTYLPKFLGFHLKENDPVENTLLLDQTAEYVNLKAKDLLYSKKMNYENYNKYFKMFTSLLHLFFRLIAEIKENFETESELSKKKIQTYMEELTDILSQGREF